ncbi:helix-turn-helix domain-containing protein [Deinococcus sp.]|uniref:helix-turn-helix domain-containing protein n=1 Tax=Deinococcus sp. TaxID=47478 RepID=UPI0025BF9808|nr:helix-turn-helix domain-containing protein [Deinococcus sp.]
MSFGTDLKQAREIQGLTTQDVALRTKIRGDYLKALEDGNTSLLPERTFARSYLQRYARELNLDPAPLLAEFDRSVPADASQTLRGPAVKGAPGPGSAATAGGSGSTRRGTGNPAILTAAVTALIVFGAGGYYAYSSFLKPAPTSVTPAVPVAEPTPAPVVTVRLSVSSVPSGAQVYLDNRDLGVTPVKSFPVNARTNALLRVEFTGRAPLKQTVDLSRSRNLRAQLNPASSTLTDLAAKQAADQAAARAAAKAAASPATDATKQPTTTPPAAAAKPAASPPAQAVNVTFTGAAWTRVTDRSGRVLFEGTPPAGSVKGFPAGVTIRTGNAGVVNVSVNGAAATSLGQPGQVVTRQF